MTNGKEKTGLGKRVYDLRVGRRWTQEQLCIAADLSKSFLSEIENGAQARGPVLVRLANALGVTIDYLLTGDPRPEAGTPTAPAYYRGRTGRVAWDEIEEYGLDYLRGCAWKYLVRAGRKTPDAREDLRKAIACIEREIELIDQGVR